MLHKLTNAWFFHFKENFVIYFLTILIFAFGIALGAVGVKTLSVTEYQELTSFFQSFLASMEHWKVNGSSIVQQTILNHWKTIFSIWFLGLTVIGIPIILLIIFIRGFVLGFTVGFIIQEKIAGGLFFALISVLPSNLFLIPIFIVSAVAALLFSLGIVKGKLRKNSISQCLLTYSILMVFLAVFAVIGGLIEAYITPLLMQAMVNYY